MEKKDKPRLAGVLGVDVGERFKVKDENGDLLGPFYVDAEGYMRWADEDEETSDGAIYIAINHPESIIRAPRLTEAELEICKATGAKWVSYKPHDSCFVMLTNGKPEWNDKYQDWLLNGNEVDDPIARIRAKLFPSVRPGDCICVEEAEK